MSRSRIPILMYHQIDVAPPKGTPLRGLVVSPGTFSRHMSLMHFLGYTGLSMGALMPYLKANWRLLITKNLMRISTRFTA